jgi:hypothetical protein
MTDPNTTYEFKKNAIIYGIPFHLAQNPFKAKN